MLDDKEKNMSAGICIMNKTAIALAADSAVTIGDHLAIHNSANKLFSLSRVAPVGVIVYSNAELMKIPIEIIIKQYKNELRSKTFSYLDEYVNDFLSFIVNKTELFHLSINEEAYVSSVSIDLLNGLLADYQILIRRKENSVQRNLTAEELRDIQREATLGTCRFVDGFSDIPGFDQTEYIKEVYGNKLQEQIKNDFPWVPDDLFNPLFESIIAAYRKSFFRRNYVGIAFAGYGDLEIFPHMTHLHLSGLINGQLRYSIQEVVEVNENQSATITPLAQTDVMQTFLFGINDNFISDLRNEIPFQIKTCLDGLEDSLFAPGKKSEVQNSLNNAAACIINQIITKAREQYLFPITNSLASLPIEELSLLAESMINITSLRRKVAIDDNIGTVGGPIDVAIISKSDGFIWLKRKHYFEQKYNPQYFYSHYFSERENQEKDDLLPPTNH